MGISERVCYSDIHMAAPLISVQNLHKWYSSVHALKGVNLNVSPGEVCGLVGDNGAGKSTLIKILAGVHQPDRGEIRIGDRLVRITSPRAAMKLGIETIYQDNSVVPTMSIARNLFLGREPLRFAMAGFGLLNHQLMRDEAMQAIGNVDLHVRSPDALLSELSGGQRQGVAIARAMHFKSRVLILDEPTNHLSVKETAKVLGFVRSLPAQGVTGILISHNLHHVFESCDRIVAMARGEIVFDKPIGETNVDEVSDAL